MLLFAVVLAYGGAGGGGFDTAATQAFRMGQRRSDNALSGQPFSSQRGYMFVAIYLFEGRKKVSIRQINFHKPYIHTLGQ